MSDHSLKVIGFEGTILPRGEKSEDASQTPARLAAIQVDELGRRLRAVGDDELEIVSGPGFVIPSTATALDAAVPFRPGHGCLVLSTRDYHAFADVDECQVADPPAHGRLRDFYDWLHTSHRPWPELGATTAHDGQLVVWYCSMDESAAVLRVIRDAAERAVLHAVARGDPGAIYEFAWWLQRAAVGDADVALAIAALHASGFEMESAALLSAVGRCDSGFLNCLQKTRERIAACRDRRNMVGAFVVNYAQQVSSDKRAFVLGFMAEVRVQALREARIALWNWPKPVNSSDDAINCIDELLRRGGT